jgi:hypothetical protein
MHILYLMVLGGVLLAPAGRAATYYVAPDGADSWDGTPDAPFRTLMRGALAAEPGDTVMVRDGWYGHETAVNGGDNANFAASPVVLHRSGTPAAWITFQAEHKGAAVLDCELVCDSYIDLLNASYIVIQGFVITRGYKEGIHSNDSAHHITLRGNRFEYIANRATSTKLGLDGMYTNPNCHDFVIDGNVFHDIGRTNASQLDHGLYLRGGNFTIVNNIFYNIQRGWAIQAAHGLTNVLIANNTFVSLAAGDHGGQIILWNTQSNLTIQNNIWYNPMNYAIVRYWSSVTACVIDHNMVYGALGLISDSSGCMVGANQTGADPMFVNVSTPPYNFHLQPQSLAIDAGVIISGITSDFDGLARSQGHSTDLGAYEYPEPIPALPAFLAHRSRYSCQAPSSSLVLEFARCEVYARPSRSEYNTRRPHSVMGYLMPAEFTLNAASP